MAASDSPVVIIGAGLAGLTVALHLAATLNFAIVLQRPSETRVAVFPPDAQDGDVAVCLRWSDADGGYALHVFDAGRVRAPLADVRARLWLALAPPPPPADRLASKTMAELVDLAASLAITRFAGRKKTDVLAAINAARVAPPQ